MVLVWECLSLYKGATHKLTKFRTQDKKSLSNGCPSILKRDGDVSHL